MQHTATGTELLFLLRRKCWPASLWLKLVNESLLPTGHFFILQLLAMGKDDCCLLVRQQLWIMFSWGSSLVPGTVIHLGFRHVCLETGVSMLSFFLDICLLDFEIQSGLSWIVLLGVTKKHVTLTHEVRSALLYFYI